MPHKHTRRAKADPSNFDLPPTKIAKPLPVKEGIQTPLSGSKQRKTTTSKYDDTPRAFARILQFQQTGKRSRDLDDGEPRKASKKRKRNNVSNNTDNSVPSAAAKQTVIPKILPGERLSDFSARVNQALPLTGLSRKLKKVEGGPKERQTRLEKKIQRRIAEWRADDEKIKDKEEEELELAEEEDAENWTGPQEPVVETGRKKKKGNPRNPDDDDDPWAKLKDARDKPKGVFDVVQAPPTFTKIPKEKFKVKNGARADVADVPRAAGSLMRRETLGETRKSIIESYRKIMGNKRNEDNK